jgi:hypothetical protein
MPARTFDAIVYQNGRAERFAAEAAGSDLHGGRRVRGGGQAEPEVVVAVVGVVVVVDVGSEVVRVIEPGAALGSR